jgi:hypothetical protein
MTQKRIEPETKRDEIANPGARVDDELRRQAEDKRQRMNDVLDQAQIDRALDGPAGETEVIGAAAARPLPVDRKALDEEYVRTFLQHGGQ